MVFVLLDVVQIPYGNAGGHLAHIGGAILGFYYAKQLKNGRNTGEYFRNFIDKVINIFRRKSNMRTVYKSYKTQKVNNNTSDVIQKQERVDEILDKISFSGYESLSQEEKDFLFKAGNK